MQPVRPLVGWAPRAAHLVLLAAASTVAALVLSLLLPMPGDEASAAGTPLQQVDWGAVLANDPAVTIDRDAYRPPGEVGPYIRVATPGQQGIDDESLQGYALIDAVEYGDLDGDGVEEAVLQVFSGGTAGNLGFLLYREGTPSPKLVLARTGYKLSATVEGTQLITYQANYVGFEPNCCPSSITRTVASLRGDSLVTIATSVEPNDVQEPTVWAFYQALSERRYEDAYAFYSPAARANTPFERWKAGFAATETIEVETQPGPTPTEVLIDLRSTDRQPGGGTVTHRFRGSWTLIWSGEQQRWLLDRARIEQVQ
jgi:hypothetical protein